MRPLRTRQQGRTRGWLNLAGWGEMDLHLLLSEQPYASPAMGPPTPVPPEEGSRTGDEWMQQHTHPAGFDRSTAMPLTLLPQWTGATLAEASGIDQPQTAISFCAQFRRGESLPSGAAQHAIGLQYKVLPREAALFEGQSYLGSCIARGGSGGIFRRRESRSKLGSSHRSWLKLMTQFEAEIPDPLGENLPALLPQRRMRTPAIGVLFQVFIAESIFKGPTMQVEGHHIGRAESALRQIREEQFVDEAVAFDTDLALRRPSRMGRYHHSTARARRPDGHLSVD